MPDSFTLFWFRQDLRLSDNPGLIKALQAGTGCYAIYILDDVACGDHKMGAASKCWLHHSLTKLNESLEGKLNLYSGDALSIMPKLVQQLGIKDVFCNRSYEPWRIEQDREIEIALGASNVNFNIYDVVTLWKPSAILKNDGTPYKVFTPFYKRGCLTAESPRKPLPNPVNIESESQTLLYIKDSISNIALNINQLNLLPTKSWGSDMMNHWKVGEGAAQNRLQNFIDDGLIGYKNGRNCPSRNNVSRLSPHLHFGEISPHQVWHAVESLDSTAHNKDVIPQEDTEHFLSELGWREFSYYLLYHFPTLPSQNFLPKFDHFPWKSDNKLLKAWQRGQTGYPIVDAGMRELWQTGYMHNRVRMIVGSFLVKNLLLHWRDGERWFWDCLVDADLANNSASWQWVAGCGADAAPYFRIFNPITQGEKFDSDGSYTRKFVPELANLPNAYLFKPWETPPLLLQEAGIILGKHYPKPIVDLKISRNFALEAFAKLKGL